MQKHLCQLTMVEMTIEFEGSDSQCELEEPKRRTDVVGNFDVGSGADM